MMSLSGGFHELPVHLEEDPENFPLGELRRDDTCLEFSGQGVRMKNMRCSSAGTNPNQVETCSECQGFFVCSTFVPGLDF